MNRGQICEKYTKTSFQLLLSRQINMLDKFMNADDVALPLSGPQVHQGRFDFASLGMCCLVVIGYCFLFGQFFPP